MGLFLPEGKSVNSYREKETLELSFETYVVDYGVGVEVGRVGRRCRNGEKQKSKETGWGQNSEDLIFHVLS